MVIGRHNGAASVYFRNKCRRGKRGNLGCESARIRRPTAFADDRLPDVTHFNTRTVYSDLESLCHTPAARRAATGETTRRGTFSDPARHTPWKHVTARLLPPGRFN